ncbi:hypothetical protein ACDQ55_21575 [Chitinophaga sp. 30R24]|uniref:hypothetical protein n=1 Tax=Chitinophaga sp. 30R24 TaxID=3248838 RepID=UPI003B8EDA49
MQCLSSSGNELISLSRCNIVGSLNVLLLETWYVRDATGNVMGVYTKRNPAVNHGDLTLISSDLYGSTRLGLLNRQENVQQIAVPVKLPMPGLGISRKYRYKCRACRII